MNEQALTSSMTWADFKAQPDAIQKLCALLVDNQWSLRAFCRAYGFALTTVLMWLDTDPSRAEQYARARDARADAMFDELDEIADSAIKAVDNVQAMGYRLKADTVKWKLSKMNNKKYGDKLEIDQTTHVMNASDADIALQMKAINDRLAQFESVAAAPLIGGDDASPT